LSSPVRLGSDAISDLGAVGSIRVVIVFEVQASVGPRTNGHLKATRSAFETKLQPISRCPQELGGFGVCKTCQQDAGGLCGRTWVLAGYQQTALHCIGLPVLPSSSCEVRTIKISIVQILMRYLNLDRVVQIIRIMPIARIFRKFILSISDMHPTL
jgi:hypothetical protein